VFRWSCAIAEEDVIIIYDEDVIIIDDDIDDEDVIIIDDDNDDEDVIIIEADNLMENDNLDEDEVDIELEPLVDSDYESDTSDGLIHTEHRNLNLTEIMALDQTKMYCISYYYVEDVQILYRVLL